MMLYRVILPMGGRLFVDLDGALGFISEAATFYGVALSATPLTPGMGRRRVVRA